MHIYMYTCVCARECEYTNVCVCVCMYAHLLVNSLQHWFGHVERMEKDRVARRPSVGECAGSRSVDRPRKRWIDIAKECLRKRGLGMSGKQGEWCRIEVNGGGMHRASGGNLRT